MYAGFAYIYDRLMQDIPYERWMEYIQEIRRREGCGSGPVLDLGCGTGNMALPMSQLGFEVTAVDLSPDMLAVAEQKARSAGLKINFINQDIRELQVPGPFGLVLAMCDSLNYLLEGKELADLFKKVYQLLQEDGLFIFDLNTPYKLAYVLGQNTYTYQDDDVAYIWENEYNRDSQICEMALTFFVHRERNLYYRFAEIHAERAYDPGDIKEWLSQASFSKVACYQELSFRKPVAKTERIFFVAGK